jgi:hypothetical protein
VHHVEHAVQDARDADLSDGPPSGRLDLREVEEVVDDPQQVLARGMDVVQELDVLGLGQVRQAIDEDLGEADDGV